MTDILISVLAFVVAIGVLVAVHEFGHYWVARRLGFRVLRFSIGFGRPLLRWRGKDADRVEYWVSAIPLGGYVKMLDEREGPVDEADAHRAFNRRPIPHRILVLLAGPGFNFLFAIVAYWALFVTGVPGIKPIVGTVDEGSIAAEAGLDAGDEIVRVGGRQTETWEHALLAILDELLADGRIELDVRTAGGEPGDVVLDVRGRESALTEPDALFDGLGFTPGPTLPAVVDSTEPGSPAAAAGLEPGDRVVRGRSVAVSASVDGRAADAGTAAGTRIQSWGQLVEFVRARPGERVEFVVERGGREVTLPVEIGTVEDNGETIGRIGVPQPMLPAEQIESYQSVQRYGVFASVGQGVVRTWDMTALTVRMLGRMLVGDVSLRSVSGPISIADYAGDYAAAGMSAFLSFLAIVSISLGIMNLLPIPILDGGQIVNQLIEWVKGSPLSDRALGLGQQLGIAFLIVLMSFVFYNDIARLLE